MWLALLLACTQPAPEPAAPAPPQVVAASYPAAWLVTRLAGPAVQLSQPCPPGEDPPTWKPSAEVASALQSADLVVANGAGYEPWLDELALSPAKLLRSADQLDLITLGPTTHQHGQGPAHTHAGVDPHTWADPVRYTKQAERVHAALSALLPEQQPQLDAELATLREQLGALDASYRAISAHVEGHRFASNHPSFNYLAQRLGLTIQLVDIDPANPDCTESKAAYTAFVSAGPNAVLLWEAPPDPALLTCLGPGADHITLDPLEQPGPNGRYDYLPQARSNATILTHTFEHAAQP